MGFMIVLQKMRGFFYLKEKFNRRNLIEEIRDYIICYIQFWRILDCNGKVSRGKGISYKQVGLEFEI